MSGHQFDSDTRTYAYNGGIWTQQGYSLSAVLTESHFNYLWSADKNRWLITGEVQTAEGFGYSWTDTASGQHESGKVSDVRGSEHTELVFIERQYNDGQWSISNVTGNGNGGYDSRYHWDSETTASSLVNGIIPVDTAETKKIDRVRNENTTVLFSLINGKVVRESRGTIEETYHESRESSGSGAYYNYAETETPKSSGASYTPYGTAIYHNAGVFEGTRTDTVERDYFFQESASRSYHESVNSEWSYQADSQGQLVYNAFTAADITAASEGSYIALMYFSNFAGILLSEPL